MRGWLIIAALLLVSCGTRTPAPAPPQAAHRIVSLVPSLTEVLFSLGAGSRVVGVTTNDTFPPEVKLLPKVGDQTPDYERLLALKPDLVIADPGMQPREIERLRQLKLPVLSLPAQSLDGLQQALTELGRVTGKERQAEMLRRNLAAQLAGFDPPPGPRPRVFVEIWNRPLMTTGSGTYVDELIRLAGGDNVYADFGRIYPQVSVEDLLQRQPDVIVLTVGEPEEARRRPGWSQLKGRLCRMDPDLLVRPTLRSPEAVEQLARLIHP